MAQKPTILEHLYDFDAQNRIVCGVDEAGRGPLAGPVCCAAVILDPASRFAGLNDSKKLSHAMREQLYDKLMESCIAHSIILIDNHTIDAINILQSTLLGMKQAIEGLSIQPALALVDGNVTPNADGVLCKAVVKGDAHSALIAAASVLAKVTRDRFMEQLDKQFPAYGFAQHKGYPTKQHYAAIEAYGITPYHRRTFLKSKVAL